MASPTGSAGPNPWSTGNIEMDVWVLSLQLEPQSLHILARLPVRDRLAVVGNVWRKRATVHNVYSYLQASIRRRLEDITGAREQHARAAEGHVLEEGLRGQPRPWALPVTGPPGPVQNGQTSSGVARARSPVAAASLSAPPRSGSHSSGSSTIVPAPPSAAGSHLDAAVPEWARAAHAVLPSKPRFLAKVMAGLDRPALNALGALSPERQFWVGVALTLHPSAWNDPDACALLYVTNLDRLVTQPMPVEAAPMPSITRQLIVPLHVGANPAISVLGLKGALHHLRSRVPTCDMAILEEHAVSTHPQGQVVLDNLVEGSGLALTAWPSLAALSSMVQEKNAVWRSQGAWVLCIVSLPSSGSGGAAQTSHGMGRNTVSSRDILQHLCEMFQSTTPGFTGETYLHVLCSPSDLDEGDTVLASRLPTSGARVVDPLRYHSRLPRSVVRLTASFDDFPYVSEYEPAPWQQAGFLQPHLPQTQPSEMEARTFLTSTFLDLLDRQVFNDGDLSPSEQNTLKAFLFQGSPDVGQRYLPRVCLYAEAGLTGLSLATIFDTVVPCCEWIVSSTGIAAPRDASYGEPCGKRRLCTGCCDALELCCAMPHIAIVADATLEVLSQRVQSSASV